MHPQPDRNPDGELVRDRVPQLMAAAGQPGAYHLADPGEHSARLRAKLLEEAEEAAAAASPVALLAKLGDVLQVCYDLAALVGSTPAEVERARARTARVRGGFARGVVWHDPQPSDGAA